MRTIKELIEVLETYPEDIPIFVWDDPITPPKPFVVKFWPDINGSGYVVLETLAYRNNIDSKDMSGKDITWEP